MRATRLCIGQRKRLPLSVVCDTLASRIGAIRENIHTIESKFTHKMYATSFHIATNISVVMFLLIVKFKMPIVDLNFT